MGEEQEEETRGSGEGIQRGKTVGDYPGGGAPHRIATWRRLESSRMRRIIEKRKREWGSKGRTGEEDT